jgi:hypothetical protein
MTKDDALRLAHEALERQGCRVKGEVGSARFFSIRGLWFRWSMGFHVEDALTGDMIIGHACVLVSELSSRVVKRSIPPRGGHRVHDPFWVPPEPLWKRLAISIVAPIGLIACGFMLPFVVISEFVHARMGRLLLPRCASCKEKLRTRLATRCLVCGASNRH